MQNARDKAQERPQSAVSYAVGICGLIGLFLWVFIARHFGEVAALFGYMDMPARADGPYSGLLAMLCCALPMICWSIFVDKVHLRESTGINWRQKAKISDIIDDSFVKLVGLWMTWALIAICYFMGRWYWQGPFQFSMQLMEAAIIPLVLLSIPYVIWLDQYLVNRRDGAWHMGAMLAARQGWQSEKIFHHLRAWAVKGFFLAFMLAIVPDGFRAVINADFAQMWTNPVLAAQILIIMMFMVDVQFASVGYLLTMRPLDAHIRTANPYMQGWVAALICYPPILLMANDRPLDYRPDDHSWAFWFAGHDMMLMIWGALLVGLTAIYAWATVAFGLRFSNLTHRGIITNGPYAWTKHPAYLSKNLFWWCATLPFITNGSAAEALRNSMILLLISAVYYWRARTEEKHLGQDPIYQHYMGWMQNNGAVTKFFAHAGAYLSSRFGRGRAQHGGDMNSQ
ncbi:protein-S-isoprenylcysteine methyltransferase [Sphingorhabdus lutea]|uniref:Protein-S-isoprenylcysteine methyltransferase n=1 Tax=Sphingorhabdus lutea TaxID=1913578 RepID=A0A1L3JFD0_9SPHN|nr:protein-S-isoprenylcysteine methyltransferase [Sphingorhabdus lutea]